MKLPPLTLIDQSHFYWQGDVQVDPSVAIAPGVLLQADPQSRIIIKSGVCLGAGVVLHAQHGSLVIEAGANLGAGTLVVGAGHIGAHTCIGPLSTVLNPLLPTGTLLPSGSLWGDPSRRVATVSMDAPAIASPPLSSAIGSSPSSASVVSELPDPWESTPAPTVVAKATAPEAPPAPSGAAAAPASTQPSAIGVQVYGQGQIHQLLAALFPNRQTPPTDEQTTTSA